MAKCPPGRRGPRVSSVSAHYVSKQALKIGELADSWNHPKSSDIANRQHGFSVNCKSHYLTGDIGQILGLLP